MRSNMNSGFNQSETVSFQFARTPISRYPGCISDKSPNLSHLRYAGAVDRSARAVEQPRSTHGGQGHVGLTRGCAARGQCGGEVDV